MHSWRRSSKNIKTPMKQPTEYHTAGFNTFCAPCHPILESGKIENLHKQTIHTKNIVVHSSML